MSNDAAAAADGENWFLYRQGMQRDDIPDTANLTHARVEAGVTAVEEDAFGNGDANGKYDSLQHIQLAASVRVIQEYAFGFCHALVTVEMANDSQLAEIQDHAFFSCRSLKELILPTCLRTIGPASFAACEALTTVIVASPAAAERTDSAIDNSDSQLRTLGSGSFRDCDNLEVVDLSHCAMLSEIAQISFYGCKALQSILLPPNLVHVRSAAFANCQSLEAVAFPATLQNIEEEAYWRCASLQSIVFPATLETIGSHAFADCTKLTTVQFTSTKALIPEWQIQESAFAGCTSLHKILFLPKEDHDNGEDALSKAHWPDLLPRLFGENETGGLLGPDSSEEQQLSCIFAFLQPRMDELING